MIQRGIKTCSTYLFMLVFLSLLFSFSFIPFSLFFNLLLAHLLYVHLSVLQYAKNNQVHSSLSNLYGFCSLYTLAGLCTRTKKLWYIPLMKLDISNDPKIDMTFPFSFLLITRSYQQLRILNKCYHLNVKPQKNVVKNMHACTN